MFRIFYVFEDKFYKLGRIKHKNIEHKTTSVRILIKASVSVHIYTVIGTRVGPRLHELAPAARGSHEAGIHTT